MKFNEIMKSGKSLKFRICSGILEIHENQAASAEAKLYPAKQKDVGSGSAEKQT